MYDEALEHDPDKECLGLFFGVPYEGRTRSHYRGLEVLVVSRSPLRSWLVLVFALVPINRIRMELYLARWEHDIFVRRTNCADENVQYIWLLRLRERISRYS